MKPISVAIFVVFLFLNVESSSLHKKQKAANVRTEETPGDEDDDDFEWPEPESVHNFDVPEAVRHGGINTGDNEEPSPAHHHGKSKHRSHSH